MLAALLATPMIFQIIGVAISAAGVVVPEIDRIAVRQHEQASCPQTSCGCDQAKIYKLVKRAIREAHTVAHYGPRLARRSRSS